MTGWTLKIYFNDGTTSEDTNIPDSIADVIDNYLMEKNKNITAK